MATKEQKDELKRLRQLFRRDLAKLKVAGYEKWEIAEKAEIDPGNLTRYASPSSKTQPGIVVLKRFYKAFEGELENPFDKITDMEDEKVNGGQQEDPKDQENQNAQEGNPGYNTRRSDNAGERPVVTMYVGDENAYLRSTINKLLDSELPYKFLDSFNQMVATHATSNETALINAKTHDRVIEAFLKKFGDGE